MPGFEGAQREDFDDCETGGIVSQNTLSQDRPLTIDAGGLLSLAAQHFAELTIDLGRALSGFGDQFDPLLSMRRQFELLEQVRSLHDGLDGITQIVNELAQLIGDVNRDFLRVGHDRASRDLGLFF